MQVRIRGSSLPVHVPRCLASITWSVLDHEREPKAGYYALQTAFQTVLIMAELGRTKWLVNTDMGANDRPFEYVLKVVNDLPRNLRCVRYTARLEGQVAVYTFQSRMADISAGSVVSLEQLAAPAVGEPMVPGQYQFVLTLHEGDVLLSANTYAVELVVHHA